MTVQMNPAGPQYLMLLVVLASLVLLVWIAIRAIRRRSVVRVAGLLVGLVALYSAALVASSVLTGATNLRPGDTKCFDEWCATMLGAQAGTTPNSVAVQVRLTNHGRRAQKSVLARGFIESGGMRSWPQNPDDLHAEVPGGGSLQVTLQFAPAAPYRSPRFVVTEGDAASGAVTPGLIVLGDESSPFHPLAGWPISTR